MSRQLGAKVESKQGGGTHTDKQSHAHTETGTQTHTDTHRHTHTHARTEFCEMPESSCHRSRRSLWSKTLQHGNCVSGIGDSREVERAGE